MRRYLRPGIGQLVFVVGLVVVGLAVFQMIQLLRAGYTYACVGQGCPYQTPGAAHDLAWEAITWPLGLILSIAGWALMVYRLPPPDLAPLPTSAARPDLWGAAPDPWHQTVRRTLRGPTDSTSPGGGLLGWGIFEVVFGLLFFVGGVFFPGPRVGWWITALILSGFVGAPMVYFGLKARGTFGSAKRIKDHGVPGWARIVQLGQPGVYMNNNPLVTMDLEVHPQDGRPPYVTRHREFVPLILLGRLTDDRHLPVAIDPADPNKLVVDWSG